MYGVLLTRQKVIHFYSRLSVEYYTFMHDFLYDSYTFLHDFLFFLLKYLICGNTLFTDYKGALTEQYVLQQLKTIKELSIYYWPSDNSRGEIDFLLQHETEIISIEVKAGKNLRTFVKRNPGLQGIRFSMSAYCEQERMIYYPLYAIETLF